MAGARGTRQPLTAFVGRVDELSQLRRRLGNGVRLLTLFGPPGIGKTRLARRLLEDIDETRGWFVDLRDAETWEEVACQMARVLGVVLTEGPSEWEASLGASLASLGRSWLVLDNCEQLAPEVSHRLPMLLAEATELQLIATSRRALRVAPEELYEVGPMTLPEVAESATHEAVTEEDVSSDENWRSDAMQLFLVRVRGLEPTFDARGPRAASVVRMVRQLEGVPLAIELAASQVASHGFESLLDALHDGVLSLCDHRAGVDNHHRSVRGAIVRSWRLLPAWAQDALIQLTVFRGGVTVSAAESVLDLTHYPDAPGFDAVIQLLRDASFLRPEGSVDPDGGTRWRAYESIREYCAERPKPVGLRDRHARHFLRCGEQWVNSLSTEESTLARGLLARELGNLEAGLEWLTQSSRSEQADEIVRMTEVLVAAAADWAPTLAIDALTRALRWIEASEIARPEVRTRLRLARARLLGDIGDYEEAQRDLDRVADASVTDEVLAASVHCERGVLSLLRGEPVAARRSLETALEFARDLGVDALEARALRFLAWVLADAFQDPSALEHYPRAAELFHRLGDLRQEIPTLMAWSAHRVFFRRGNPGAELADRLALARRHQHRWAEVGALIALGILRQDDGDLSGAEEVLREACAVAQRAGLRRYQAAAEMHLATVLDECGESYSARRLYGEAAERFERIGELRLRGLCHVFLAGLVAREGNAVHAAGLIERANALFDGDDGFRREANLQRAQVELALSRAALGIQDRSTAKKHRERAEKRVKVVTAPRSAGRVRLPPLIRCCPDARFVLRMLHRELSRVTDTARELVVWSDGSAFVLGAGAKVALSSSKALRRLLAHLARRRAAAPGEPVTRNELVAHTWPDEVVAPEAASIRVRNAISRLRKAGLGDVILTARSGYLLDGSQPFRIVGTEPDDLMHLTVVNH